MYYFTRLVSFKQKFMDEFCESILAHNLETFMDSNEELTYAEIKKRAYLMALRLKNSGLDEEVIYARLEKQGIPVGLAREVAHGVLVQKRREIIEETEPIYNFALTRIGIGVAIAILSFLIFPGNVVIPVGMVAGGIVGALFAKKKMEG